MTATYKTGTVATTNGNATVVGTGTAWVVAAVAGGMFSCDGLSVPIASITDDTHLTLDYPWPGTTGTGKSYSIMRENSDASDIVDMHDKLAALLVTLSIAGIHPNSAGTLAQRNALSLNASNDGYLFLQAELGVAFAFYRWDGTALAWVGPFPVASATTAAAGVQSIVAGGGIGVDNTNPNIPIVALGNVATATVKGRAAAGTGAPSDLSLSQVLDMIGSAAQGDILYRGSSTWQRLAAGTALRNLRMNAAATAPEWGPDREVITANRTYFVGFDMGAVAISIASPAVVTKNAHGLVAGSRCSFSIKPNRKTATISVASPAVVTMANTFAAGQPIIFETSGRLPKGLSPQTVYYVIATGLSTSSFQISATVGGAAINTSNPTFTVTIASPGVVTETGHGRSTGDAIQLATTGALPTGLAAATTYFINVIDANTYNLRLTPEGANINTSGTQSGTHSIVQFGTHYLSESGALPTGITAGQDYYVIATGLTANTFQFSATAGGAAINTSGTQSGTIVMKTGSDANDGLTTGTPLLTLQAAWNKVAALDLSIFAIQINVADGQYNDALTISAVPVGGSQITINGNTTNIGNVFLNVTTHAMAITNALTSSMIIQGFKFKQTGASICGVLLSAPGTIVLLNNEFNGGSTGFAGAIQTQSAGAKINVSTGNMFTGNMSCFVQSANGGFVQFFAVTITVLNVPVCSWINFVCGSLAMLLVAGVTWGGNAKGVRYSVGSNAYLNSGGAGITYLPGDSAGSGTNSGVAPYGLYT